MDLYAFDDDYLERLRAGDYRTLDHCVRYFTEFLGIKLRFRLRPEDIEDVRQTTFVRLFEALHQEGRIRDGTRLGAFVNSICVNVLREHYRKYTPDQADEDAVERIPDFAPGPEGHLARQETQRIVREILDALPERDRRILQEVFLNERAKDDICRDYRMTRGNLRVVVSRAKEKFRSQLRKRPPGPGSKGKAAD